jgi:hypothetical protein
MHKLLGLICSITFRFSLLDCLNVLYFTLVRSKLEYISVVWNSVTSTDANKLGCMQQKFAFISFYHFFPHVPCSYTVEKLNWHFLRKRRHHLDALFYVQLYCGHNSCTSLLENISFCVPAHIVSDLLMFSVCPSNKHCPSAQCDHAASVVGKDLDIFAVWAVFSRSYL